jgi:uncharacterized protein HemY
MKKVVFFVLAVSLFVAPCFAGEHSSKTSFVDSFVCQASLAVVASIAIVWYVLKNCRVRGLNTVGFFTKKYDVNKQFAGISAQEKQALASYNGVVSEIRRASGL